MYITISGFSPFVIGCTSNRVYYLVLLVWGKQVWHFTRVQHVIDVLQKRFSVVVEDDKLDFLYFIYKLHAYFDGAAVAYIDGAVGRKNVVLDCCM